MSAVHPVVGAVVVMILLGGLAGCDAGSGGGDADPHGSTPRSVGVDTGIETSPVATSLSLGVPGSDSEPGAATCWSVDPQQGEGIEFTEATDSYGLVKPLTGMYGHAVAAGDANGDGWIDLFVGSFADRPTEQYQVRGATGPSPDSLMLGGEGGFTVDRSFPGEPARTSGATMADLDADGDLDLVVVRNPRGDEIAARPTVVYEQREGGWHLAEELLPGVAGRSVAAIDVDRDGLLDLIVVADRFGGGSARLLHNEGSLEFVDAGDQWGIPDDITGLALATVDLDLDGWSDIVVSGDERVLMGGPDGFSVDEQDALAFELFGAEDDPAGIAVGDLDLDGRPDLVIGQHFNSTVDDGRVVPVRIFVNRPAVDGFQLVDVTSESGSPGLRTKSPHVAIADLDNDGTADVVTSAVSASGAPLILRGLGVEDGVPMFEATDRAGDGDYFVTGIEADLDRDGRVDLFQVAWEPSSPSLLFMNESASEHWLEVGLAGLPGGVGDVLVEVFEPGSGNRLATGWGLTTTGYAAGAPASVHLGLGADPSGDGQVQIVVTPRTSDELSFTAAVDSRINVTGC